MQFSAAASDAVSLVVGARSGTQIMEDYNSMQTKIPAEFWEDLMQQNLVHQDAALPPSPRA